MTKIIRLSILLLFPLIIQGQLSSFSYTKSLRVNADKVEGTGHTDFPILIKHRDLDLAHTSFGGFVENINGYDIIFTASDGTTILDHELRAYDPSSGGILAWVKVPVLSGTVNTTLHMYYGSAVVSADQSNKDTWNNGFMGVWHLDDNQFEDASENVSDLSNGGTSPSIGVHGAARAFNNSYLDSDSDGDLQISQYLTLDSWVNLTSIEDEAYDNPIFSYGLADVSEVPSGNYQYWLNIDASNPGDIRLRAYWEMGNGVNIDCIANAPILLNTGAWNKITFVRDWWNDQGIFYLNGVMVGTPVTYSNAPSGGGDAYLRIGRDQKYPSLTFNGILDEARISNVARTAEWVATDFNSQKKASFDDPASLSADINSFYVLGTHTSSVHYIPIDPNCIQELAGWTPPTSINFNDAPINLNDYLDPIIYSFGDDVVFNNGIVNPTYALGDPGGLGARVEEPGDILIVDITDTIKVGAYYELVWRRGTNAGTLSTVSPRILESVDNITYYDVLYEPQASGSGYVIDTLYVENDTRFLQFRHSAAYNDYFIDGIRYLKSGGVPGGGFTGPGMISANIFDPAGLSGPIDITYTITDPCLDEVTQTINVIAPVVMTAFNDTAFCADYTSMIPVNLIDNDFEGGFPLQLSHVTIPPVHGSVVNNLPKDGIEYTSSGSYFPVDSFQVAIYNSNGDNDLSWVFIEYQPTVDPYTDYSVNAVSSTETLTGSPLGGTWYQLSTPDDQTPIDLGGDIVTVDLNVGAGEYIYEYVLASYFNSCSDREEITITLIDPTCNNPVSYPTYCYYNIDELYIYSESDPIGTFTTDPGMIINSTTGTIDLGSTIPGEYTVVFTDGVGSCSRTMNILVVDTAVCSVLPANDTISTGLASCLAENYTFSYDTAHYDCLSYNQTTGLPSGSDYPLGLTTNQIDITMKSQTIPRLYFGWNDNSKNPGESNYGPDAVSFDSGVINSGIGSQGGGLEASPSGIPPNLQFDGAYLDFEGVEFGLRYAHDGSQDNGTVLRLGSGIEVNLFYDPSQFFLFRYRFQAKITLVEAATGDTVETAFDVPYPIYDQNFHYYYMRYNPNTGALSFTLDNNPSFTSTFAVGNPGDVLLVDPSANLEVCPDFAGGSNGVLDEFFVNEVTLDRGRACSFDVLVADSIAPVPDILVLPLISDVTPYTATAPTATDNCDGPITATTTDPITFTSSGLYTISWDYTDSEGNASTQDQQIFVLGGCPLDYASWTPPAFMYNDGPQINLKDYLAPEEYTYADTVTMEDSVANDGKILGNPDDDYAEWQGLNDSLIIDLTDTLPAGAAYEIIWRMRDNGSVIGPVSPVMYESLDNNTFTAYPFAPSTSSITQVFDTIYTTSPTRYLKFILDDDDGDFEIDAIRFLKGGSVRDGKFEGPGMVNDSIFDPSGQLGNLSFEYIINSLCQDTAYRELDLRMPLVPPSAVNDTLVCLNPFFTTIPVLVLANDLDADIASVNIVEITHPSAYGTTVIGAALDALEYTISGGTPIVDSIQYVIENSSALRDTAWVFIEFEPISNIPADYSSAAVNPTVILNGDNPEGVWTQLSTPTSSSDVIFVNDTVSVLLGDGIGVYEFEYALKSFFNNCSHKDTLRITLTDPSCIGLIKYPTYCYSAEGYMMVKENIAPGGIFSEATGDLVIDPITGTLDLNSTPVGTYDIVYTIGICMETVQFTVIDSDLCSYFPADQSFSTVPGSCDSDPFIYDLGTLEDCDAITVTQTNGQASGTAFPKGSTSNDFDVSNASQTISRLYFGWNDPIRNPMESYYGPDGYAMDSGEINTSAGYDGGALRSNPLNTPPNIRIADGGYFDFDGMDVSFFYAHDGSLDNGRIIEKKGSFGIGYETIFSFHTFGLNLLLVDPDDPGNISNQLVGPYPYPPNDNDFHHYRFRYDPNDGIVYFQYDNGPVDATDLGLGSGWVLAHDPAQDFHICEDYDGIGKGVLDELKLSEVTLAENVTCNFLVTVTDDEDPNITGYNPNMFAFGSCNATFGNPIVSDNCPGPYTITSDISPNVSGVGTHSIEWTVTDAAGNTAQDTRSLSINDSTAPVPDIATLSDITAECSVGSIPPPTATDICEGSIIAVTSTGFPITSQGTTTITWTYDDGNGNTSIQTQNVVIDDVTAPVADVTPLTDVTAECQVSSLTPPTATDNCGGFVTVSNDASLPISTQGTTTITWTYDDGNGNTSIQTQNVVIDDLTAPEINCPDDINTSTDPGMCSAVVNFSAPIGLDNCPGSITAQTDITGLSSGDAFPVGTTTIEYTVTAANGVTAVCSFDVIVTDITSPTISLCAPDVTESLDGSCQFVLPDYTGVPTVSDNCTATGDLLMTQSPAASTSLNGHGTTQTVTLTVSDANGNTSQCSFVITLEDDVDPAISCPSDINTGVDAGECFATVTWMAPMGADNCSGETTIQTGGATSGSTFAVGTHTIEYTTTDIAGNTATCTFDIIVSDDESPLISACAPNTTVSADAGCGYMLADYTSLVTANDNCTPTGGLMISQTPAIGSAQTGTQTVTLTVMDIAGNTSTCDFTVSVSDDTAPVMTNCPTDMTEDLDGGCLFVLPDYTGVPTVSDNCTATGDLLVTQSPAASTSLNGHGTTQTVTLTVSDANGNTSQCSFVITLEDDVDPAISCPSDINTGVDAGECFATVTWMAPMGADNCSGVSTIQTGGATSGSTFAVGTHTIEYTTTDIAGNTATCTFDIIVSDDESPLISACAPNTTVSADADCGYTLADYTTLVTANDNCTPTGGLMISQTPAIGSAQTGAQTVTLTVMDGAGNTSTCDFMVSVIDDTAPMMTNCPSDVTESVDGSCQFLIPDYTGIPIVSDNCTAVGDLVVTQSPAALTSLTGHGTTQTVTLTVSDANGNTTQCSFDITLDDDTTPVITDCPTSSVETLDSNCQFLIPDYTSSLSFIENCMSDSELAITQDPVSGTPIIGHGTTQTVTLTVIDAGGNSDECSFTITVMDDESPIPMAPELTTIELVACEYTLDVPTASDNCTPGVLLGTTAVTTFFAPTDILVTWTYTDEAGNTSTQTQQVILLDEDDPIITCPEDVVIGLDDNCEYTLEDYTGQVVVGDNCTATDQIIVTQNVPVGTILTGNDQEHVIMIQAEDESGNQSTCSVTITTEDQIAPTITCPEDISVTTDVGECSAQVDLISATAIENCGSVFIMNDFSGSGLSTTFNTGLTVVTWQAGDENGNFHTCPQNVMVVDQEAPIMTATQMTVPMTECEYVFTDLTDLLGISDNCTAFADLTISTDVGIGDVLTTDTMIDYLITDASGNATEAVLNLILVDVTAPLIECVADIAVIADEGSCEASVNVEMPTYSDCAGATLEWIQGEAIFATGVYPIGETMLEWIAIDGSGNSSGCTTSVTATPSSEAMVDCPADIILTADPGFCSVAAIIDLPIVQGFCAPLISNSLNENEQAEGTFPIGVSLVTYTVADLNNELTCTVEVSVIDETIPNISCPPNITQCGTDVVMDQPEVEDLCGAVTVTNDFTSTDNGSGIYPNGVSNVLWTAVDEYGNEASCITEVEVQENLVEINAGADINLDFIFEVMLDATLPAGATGEWTVVEGDVVFSDLNDPNAMIYGLGLGYTVLEWTVDYGLCGIQSDQMSILIEGFMIPTGFSPNEDGINDSFFIRGLEALEGQVKLQVFTRWGTKVYASDDYKNDWRGENLGGNQLPPDTYYCIIELPDGAIHKGAVELRR